MATYVNSVPQQDAVPRGEARFPWKQMLWFGALLIICYAPVLYRLGAQWKNDEDMGHGFFVPIIAGYIIWQRRFQLAALNPEPNYWGLVLIVWGAVQLMLGTLGAELFLSRTAFLISLVGVIWFLGGTKILRALSFPLFLLIFMIPIPAIVYARITLPLQIFASRVAENVLGWVNIPVLRDGNVLELASQKLSVAEACSGIRSLLSLSFLSLIYAYFFDNKVWMRGALLIGTIPIAIAANASRVTLTGILSEVRTDLAEGAFHMFEGWVLFLVALALLVALHKLINFIYYRFSGRAAGADGLKHGKTA
jgi:exosortase